MTEDLVTLLLTDVEGSTRMMETDPDRTRRLLAEHDRVVAETADRYRGRFVRSRSEGDSAFLVFDDPGAGVSCAVALQQALAGGHAGEPLRVRMGLHRGRPHHRGEQLYGPVVNRCGAVRNLGHGGQILLSSAVVEATSGGALPGVSLTDLGEHRLKGVNDRERIFQVVHPELGASFPPLRSPDVLGTNLVAPADDFVDPGGLVDACTAAVAAHRLVTIVGAGGLGKTRLATEVGLAVLDDHDGGVWFADLAGSTASDAVASSLAIAVGVREQPGRPLMDTIADHLRPRRALLVLDGCEGARAEVAAAVALLLATAPDLRVLATSRQAIGVPGEQVEVLAPLPAAAAVELFAVRTRSRADPELAELVASQLEGIPLAIELAAAHAGRDGSGGEIVALSRWLDRQEGDALTATLDWSYELLDAAERALLARSSLFVGGFTLEAAEGVCTDGVLDELDVLDALGGLASKSLLQVADAAGGARYGMYEMVRQYARDRLTESGAAELFARRHHDWFSALVSEYEAALYGPDQVAALDLLESEHANVLAALASPTAPADARLWTAASLARFWQVRGHWSQGLWTLRALLAEPTELHHPRAHAQATAGLMALNLADHAGAEAHFDAARRSYLDLEASGDDDPRRRAAAAGLQGAAYYLGDLARTRGDLPAAREAYAESLARARELGDERGALSAQFGLGTVLGFMGELEEAIAHLSDALTAIRETGDAAATAQILNNLGAMKWFAGDFGDAHALYEESLAIRRGIGDVHGIAESLRNLADVAVPLGRPGAAEMCSESVELARSIGDRRGAAEALLLLTEAALADGDPIGADRTLCEAEDEVATLGDIGLTARALLRRSVLLRMAGDTAGAIETAVAAVDAYETASDTAGWASSLAALALAHTAAGDVDAASTTVRRALADPPTAVLAGLDVLEAAAVVIECRGDDASPVRSAVVAGRHRLGVSSGRLSLPPGGAQTVSEALAVARARFQ